MISPFGNVHQSNGGNADVEDSFLYSFSQHHRKRINSNQTPVGFGCFRQFWSRPGPTCRRTEQRCSLCPESPLQICVFRRYATQRQPLGALPCCHLTDDLGASMETASLIWLVNPVFGVFVQPLLGRVCRAGTVQGLGRGTLGGRTCFIVMCGFSVLWRSPSCAAGSAWRGLAFHYVSPFFGATCCPRLLTLDPTSTSWTSGDSRL